MTTRMPFVLRAVLVFVPARHRSHVMGDIVEEFDAFVRPTRSMTTAQVWLWVTTFRAAGAGFGNRIYDGARRIIRAVMPGPRGPQQDKRGWMDKIGQDLKYSFRRLIASPGFTLVAVLSLALGIGANTALFTIVNTLLLGDSGVEDPSTLVKIYTSDSGGARYATFSFPDFFDLREGNEVFEDVVSSNTFLAQTELDGQAPELTMGEVVTGSYFETLGIRPILGRTFLPEEDVTPDTHPVVMIGYDYWQRSFEGSRDVLGKSVRILRRPYTIVGVVPNGFGGNFPGVTAEMFVPSMMTDHVNRSFGGPSRLDRRGSRSSFVTARLKDGVSVEQAEQYVIAFSAALAEEYPDTNEGRVMTLLSAEDVALHPFVDKAMMPVAGLLFAVVGMVLLIACTNLASFLLARGADRKKEIAVRLALGARRGTLVRQLLTETMLLAVLGGVGGILLAKWTVALVIGFQPPIPINLNLNLPIDQKVFAFNMAIALGAGLVFGLIPALQSTRPDVAPTLRDESGGQTGSKKGFGLRNALVSAQVALSFVLLIGAGLFVRSLQKAGQIDPGFYTGEAAMVWPNMEMSLIGPDEGAALWDDLVERAAAIPGVTHVALMDRVPLGFGFQTRGVVPEGFQLPEGVDNVEIDYGSVGPNYFEALDIPILRGRAFSDEDVPESEGVAIVNEAFVQQYWPGESGVGKTVEDRAALRIVGVAANTKSRTLGEDPRPQIFVNLGQRYIPSLFLFVRGTIPEAQILGQLQSTIRTARSDLVVMDGLTMTQHMELPLFAPRLAAILLTVFGSLALVLSGIGLYGVVSYAVSQRTREVGIRMSLGADAMQVVRMVVGSGLKLVVVGGFIGLILSGAVTWVLSSFLYGIGTLDVATFIMIPALLTAVAGIAAFVPARRASRLNPVEALRRE